MIEPLIVEFSVDTPPRRAFELWTRRAATSWPRGHTMGQSDAYDIIFEGRPGGRVFERSADGSEHDWGEVIDWEAPQAHPVPVALVL